MPTKLAETPVAPEPSLTPRTPVALPSRPSQWRAPLANVGRALVVPLVALILWQFVSDPRTKELSFFQNHPTFAEKLPGPLRLPPPTKVFKTLVAYAEPVKPFADWQETLSGDEQKAGGWKTSKLRWATSGDLWADALASLRRVLVGFGLGTLLALPLGLMMGASDRVYGMMNPVLQILRPIPPIAYIPLAMAWFGLGDPPAYFLVFLGAFFPVLVNTISGVRNVDGIYLRAARNLGASGPTLFRRVILPAATPYILTGARVGVGVGFICVIVAEMLAVNSGLGYRIINAREYQQLDLVIAGMISIGVLGFALDAVMVRLNTHLLRWHRGADERGH